MIKIVRAPVAPPLTLRSFTHGRPEQYTVSITNRTCTCADFDPAKLCKHLDAVGVYPVKKWRQSKDPSFSQALSGLVKCLRLRNLPDALYWLLYLDRFTYLEKGSRFRVARRLLIGSAEDGMSISVMERVARNFTDLCKDDTHVIMLAAEVVRICSVPNWWQDAGGQDYIHAGLLGNRRYHLQHQLHDLNIVEKIEYLRAAIDSHDRPAAMTAFEALVAHDGLTKVGLANIIRDLAIDIGCMPAERLINVHLSAKSALSHDANFIGQAVWWLAGGVSEVVDTIEVVMSSVVKGHLNVAAHRLEDPMIIPGWCCDGVHCGGTDRRFAGMWSDMWAVCAAYNHYGYIDPESKWLRSFYSMEDLPIV